MDFMDESGEIRATAFRDQVDKYYDMIEVDKVYYVSKCQLKPANKQYSQIKNDYEMTFNSDTIVQECMEEASSIPQISYDLIPITQIGEVESNKLIDVLGVVKEVSDIQTLTARTTGRELTKREITLVDQSNASVNLTMWGDEARNFDGAGQPVLLVKGARITEFGGGKSLGMISSTVIKMNPDIPEGHRLRGWFENGGADNVSVSVSARTGGTGGMSTEWVTFAEAKERNLGAGDKPDYFQTRGYIHTIRSNNAVYKACPTPECNKKVVDQENGMFRCEKCNQDFPNFKYRLLCSVSFCESLLGQIFFNFFKFTFQALIGDWTGNRWCTMFSDVAENLLGKTSQEVGEAIANEQAEEIFSSVNFKNQIFKFRTKMEVYGDVPRNKTNVVAANPINYKEYNAQLIKRIQDITGVGKMN
jgi:replication factor A1